MEKHDSTDENAAEKAAKEGVPIEYPHYNDFINYFRRFIKEDDTALQLAFLTGVSAYTRNPVNLFLKGPSSIGKSYIATTVLGVFPDEDVWFLGSMSPKSLIHHSGILIDENGVEIKPEEKPGKDAPLEEKEAWRRRVRNARTLIDMRGKILLFLEAPHPETFMILRPLLSHDTYEIQHQFVEKNTAGGLATRSIILRGWPATIFCTTYESYVEELATRSITATPSQTPEKYREALRVAARNYVVPFKTGEIDEARRLTNHLRIIREIGREAEVAIPFAGEVAEEFPVVAPRVMRDFKTLLRLVAAVALLEAPGRMSLLTENGGEKKTILIATLNDLNTALNALTPVFEETVTGLSSTVLRFHRLLAEKFQRDEFTAKDAETLWRANDIRGRSVKTIYRWLNELEKADMVSHDDVGKEKRFRVIAEAQSQVSKISQNGMGLFLKRFGEKELENWLRLIVSTCPQGVSICHWGVVHPLKPENIGEYVKILSERLLIQAESHENIVSQPAPMSRQSFSPQIQADFEKISSKIVSSVNEMKMRLENIPTKIPITPPPPPLRIEAEKKKGENETVIEGLGGV